VGARSGRASAASAAGGTGGAGAAAAGAGATSSVGSPPLFDGFTYVPASIIHGGDDVGLGPASESFLTHADGLAAEAAD